MKIIQNQSNKLLLRLVQLDDDVNDNYDIDVPK
jgi:hypothetical protein